MAGLLTMMFVLQEKYKLTVPAYPGAAQCVKI